ncbi:MAG TPA: hypothetical protein VFD57_06980, partial [Clostridia bacterium]|nr:hypothetical protein [Clostridia bacterium]
MRYSRMKRGRSQRKYVSMIIAMVVIFGGIYFFTAGAMGKHISKWVAPFLKADNGVDPVELENPVKSERPQDNPDTQLTLPDKQDGEKDHVPRITETIKVEEMKFHAIQMGAFNDGENAKSIAEQL